MNRRAFLLLYATGIVVMLFAGNPWSRVSFLLLDPSKPGAALTASFALAMLVPIALVPLAALRGRSIDKPRLHLFPVSAIVLSASAFVYGWLSRALAGGEPGVFGFLPAPLAIGLGLLAAFGPLALHVACCVTGAAESVDGRAAAARGAGR